MAARRTNTFGAIIPTIENAIFAHGIQAFQEELGTLGIADALLLIGHARSPESYEFLRRRHMPFLIAWAYDAAKPNLSIGFDNRQPMRALADQVLALGHRRVAMISAPRETNDRARDRADGITDAMRARGLDPKTLAIIKTPYSIDNGRQAFAALMHATPRPTVVMCGNDVPAAGALVAARSLGLRVPEEVSITGFDDIEIAQIMTPALTTVHVPHREMGREAARMLVELRGGTPITQSVRLDATIRMRQSLGPAPAPD